MSYEARLKAIEARLAALEERLAETEEDVKLLEDEIDQRNVNPFDMPSITVPAIGDTWIQNDCGCPPHTVCGNTACPRGFTITYNNAAHCTNVRCQADGCSC